VDTPDGVARALRGRLTFMEIDPEGGGIATSRHKEVCPLSFSFAIHGVFADCHPDRCLLFAHALRYSKEDTLALMCAIDGVPGCDEDLRSALLATLLPGTTTPVA